MKLKTKFYTIVHLMIIIIRLYKKFIQIPIYPCSGDILIVESNYSPVVKL